MATSLKNTLFPVTNLDALLIISKLNVQLITERKATKYFLIDLSIFKWLD